jgi:hypothetical protein
MAKRYMRHCPFGTFALIVALAAASRAQEPPAESKDPVAEKRIAYLRGRMARYEIRTPGAAGQKLTLDEPLGLRWSNPVSGVVDGGIFFWTDGRRPLVVAKCYINEQKLAWGEAIQSISPGPLVMTLADQEVWKPASPGIKFYPVPNSPPPAATAGGRLTQMRALARRLEVIGFWGEKEPSEWSLRMLTTPAHRYSSEPDEIADGAIFAFTQGGTNPEAVALVEAVGKPEMLRWQVAVTRLSQYPVRAKLDGELIADLPRNEKPKIDETYYRGWHWFSRYPFADEPAP